MRPHYSSEPLWITIALRRASCFSHTVTPYRTVASNSKIATDRIAPSRTFIKNNCGDAENTGQIINYYGSRSRRDKNKIMPACERKWKRTVLKKLVAISKKIFRGSGPSQSTVSRRYSPKLMSLRRGSAINDDIYGARVERWKKDIHFQ